MTKAAAVGERGMKVVAKQKHATCNSYAETPPRKRNIVRIAIRVPPFFLTNHIILI